MIATLIEKLSHGDLKVMANLLCSQIKEGRKGIKRSYILDNGTALAPC